MSDKPELAVQRYARMTVEDVRKRVEALPIKGGFDPSEADDASSHQEEDQIHQDVLRAIADGAENPAELAREALETLDKEFYRWCE